MKKVFVKTSNYELFQAAIRGLDTRGAQEAGWLLVAGDPARGKSTIVDEWAAKNDAIYLRAKEQWTPSFFIDDLAEKLRADPSGKAKARFQRVVAKIGHERLRLNYDAGNAISHRPAHKDGAVDPANDALLAMPWCGHVHIKDVRVTNDGYFFTPLGRGDIDCGRILCGLCLTPLSLSIELPLRLHRRSDAQPRRSRTPIPLSTIQSAIQESLAFVSAHLAPTCP